ncbi:MAG: MoaD/ThiS family protein [Sphingobacteriia bacterium]|nr:MAG: MoaD/ThiS family protein [Sphingobacteriia bacterium]TAG30281.1 MAG: MoaD/ThiS family protein [Sphingobacteriia bacterium]TAH08612.1 MAG: MoaD/ThiS family protein [Sphingobacteriia bacterium]
MMNNAMKILFFGSLTDIIGVADLCLNGITDTDALQQFLKAQYPMLSSAKYFIAVNQKMISANTPLKTSDTVALMPPFSGG